MGARGGGEAAVKSSHSYTNLAQRIVILVMVCTLGSLHDQ